MKIRKPKKSFLFTREYWQALRNVAKRGNSDLVLECLDIICGYSLDGERNEMISWAANDALHDVLPGMLRDIVDKNTIDDNGQLMYLTSEDIQNKYQHKQQHIELLRSNGHYGQLGAAFGYLGGRPRKNPLIGNENPLDNPLKNAENPLDPPPLKNIQDEVKTAIERAALGYSIPVMESPNTTIVRHIPPKKWAAQIVLDPDYIPAKENA